MNTFRFVLSFTLAIAITIGCGSDAPTPTEEEPETQSNPAGAGGGEQFPEEQPRGAGGTAEPQPELSPKEQYVADARKLTDDLIEIVDRVSDPASAVTALEECNQLKPKAEELGKTAREMVLAVRNDPAGRRELVEYLQSKCHSDAELQPLIAKLGESEKSSKYPQLLRTVVELLETAMHNHF